MTDFTFICVCYNQDDCIVEHMESIKDIINKYGKNINNYMIIADDCSKDSTVVVARKWIEENKNLFVDTDIIASEVNAGTVKNILNAVDRCKTKDFKVLAGDDKYYDNDIYELYKNMGEDIIITPVIPVCSLDAESKQRIRSMKRSFELVTHYRKNNRLDVLMRIKNHLMAPGVFVPGKYWYDESLRNQLKSYTLVEDVPMWMNLIVDQKINTKIVDKPYVCYSLPTTERLVNGKTISELRQKDNELIEALNGEYEVNYYEKIKYYLNKVIFTFIHR